MTNNNSGRLHTSSNRALNPTGGVDGKGKNSWLENQLANLHGELLNKNLFETYSKIKNFDQLMEIQQIESVGVEDIEKLEDLLKHIANSPTHRLKNTLIVTPRFVRNCLKALNLILLQVVDVLQVEALIEGILELASELEVEVDHLVEA